MGLFCYYRDYLWHVLKAKTRHGTHSPFVYRLLEEVIYPGRLSAEPNDKVERLSARLVLRFGQGRVFRQFEPKLTDIDSDMVLILDNIHLSAERRQEWRTLQSLASATVTIDFFHVGVVFFRKGQAKEHFRIRY